MKQKIEIQRLRELLKELDNDARDDLAKRCETSVNYLWQIAGGHRRASVELAKKIEKETLSCPIKLSLAELMPHVFDNVTAA